MCAQVPAASAASAAARAEAGAVQGRLHGMMVQVSVQSPFLSSPNVPQCRGVASSMHDARHSCFRAEQESDRLRPSMLG
jgi:hypothetical protein